MTQDGLKLTVYTGERSRAGRLSAADALAAVFGARRLETSLVLRGTTGFGHHHHLRTDRLLTLSEDLPLVSIAVDTRERITAALRDVEGLGLDGLVTLERARLLTGDLGAAAPPGTTKLTLYLGRGERAGGRPAHEAAVDVLHRHGIAGASVLLGVDGTARGIRRRARFFGTNAGVPLMIVSVGDGVRIAAALPELEHVLARPLATLERVRVCKRDGVGLEAPHHPLETATPGLVRWQKLMIYASEQSRHAGAPLYAELVRRLRRAGAAGATSLRGIRGFHGDHRPHGDTLWQLRRRVPMVTVVIDTPERIRRWWPIVDEVTGETGLVTSEVVPALRRRD